jgi:hypothetical protein
MPRDKREVPPRMGGYPPPPPRGEQGPTPARSSTHLRVTDARTTAGDMMRSVNSPPQPAVQASSVQEKNQSHRWAAQSFGAGNTQGVTPPTALAPAVRGSYSSVSPPPDFSQDTTEIPSLPLLLSPNEEAHEGDIADDTGVANAPFPPVDGGGQLLLPTAMVLPLQPLDIVEVMPPGPDNSSLRLTMPLGFDDDAAPPQRKGVSAAMAGVDTKMSPRTAARAPMGDKEEPTSPPRDVLAQVDGDSFQQVPWFWGRLGNNFWKQLHLPDDAQGHQYPMNAAKLLCSTWRKPGEQVSYLVPLPTSHGGVGTRPRVYTHHISIHH